MKLLDDGHLIERLSKSQGGVFSTSDLRAALSDEHSSAFRRRMTKLLEHKVLIRFSRGFYVTDNFELPVLSQRMAPGSSISFETVLARDLVIGTNPTHRVVATKVGRTRCYSGCGYQVEHVGISAHLNFGVETVAGVRYADAEKAVLDTLYFHLWGRRFAFDIYSDINVSKLDLDRVDKYLTRYRNAKFVAFAKRVLGLVS